MEISFGLDALSKAAKDVIGYAGQVRIILFKAPMGAGKTTLIKEIARQLGCNDHFGSPTFSIVNEYQCGTSKLYHFDLYRVKDVSELYDIGMEEYLDSGNYCLIEWPELAEPMLQSEYIIAEIVPDGENRRMRLSKPV